MPHTSSPILFTDADNTLWNTDRIYAKAQLSLLRDIEAHFNTTLVSRHRLAFVRSLDQSIAANHESGLRYPPILLIQALAEKGHLAKSDTSNPQTADAVEQMEQTFSQVLSMSVPGLRRGVRSGLKELFQHDVEVIIVTEGSERRCRQNLQTFRLDPYVSNIRSGPKSPSLFADLANLYSDRRKFFVGDQLDVDIALAHAAGFETIYYPSKFRPKWVRSLETIADHTIRTFSEVPIIVTRSRD